MAEEAAVGHAAVAGVRLSRVVLVGDDEAVGPRLVDDLRHHRAVECLGNLGKRLLLEVVGILLRGKLVLEGSSQLLENLHTLTVSLLRVERALHSSNEARSVVALEDASGVLTNGGLGHGLGRNDGVGDFVLGLVRDLLQFILRKLL